MQISGDDNRIAFERMLQSLPAPPRSSSQDRPTPTARSAPIDSWDVHPDPSTMLWAMHSISNAMIMHFIARAVQYKCKSLTYCGAAKLWCNQSRKLTRRHLSTRKLPRKLTSQIYVGECNCPDRTAIQRPSTETE